MTISPHPESKPGETGSHGLRFSWRIFLLLLALIAICLWAIRINQSSKERRGLVRVKQVFQMMGTFVEITVVAPEAKDPVGMIEAARAEIARIDNLFSSYKEDSVVTRLNRLPAGAPFHLASQDVDVLEVFEAAAKISEWSEGTFDITFASVGRLWSFDPLKPRIPTQNEIAAALGSVGYRNVAVDRRSATITILKEGTQVGFGGIAKGAAVDRAIEHLKAVGARGAMVNAGGDLRAFGEKENGLPWKTGIQDPGDKSRRIPEGGLPLKGDVAVVTSGDYERFVVVDGKRYHHILNPRTGMPTEGLRSVTVWAPSAMWADGLATAFFVLGPEQGLALAQRLHRVEAFFITQDNKTLWTAGVPDSLRNAPLGPLSER
jgi:thiamine biosynthesis lipoprotein